MNSSPSKSSSWADRFLLLFVTMFVLAFVLAPSALAQPDPVDVQIRSVFGTDIQSCLVVELENRTPAALDGVLELSVRDANGHRDLYEIRTSLPPRASRHVQFEFAVAGQIFARFIVDGDVLGEQSSHAGLNAAPVIVLLADPPRLRAQLIGLQGEVEEDWGGTRRVEYELGEVRFDPASGDPIAPQTLQGWRGVDIVIAALPELERLSPTQQRALHDWVFAGGRMFVYPRTVEDLAGMAARRFLGQTHFRAGSLGSGVPIGAPERIIEPVEFEAWRHRSFGGSRSVGFGQVWITTFNMGAPQFNETGTTRDAIRSLVDYKGMGHEIAAVPFGEQERGNRYNNNGVDFHRLRAALDPNESFRPALGLVAIVLLLYVFFVGPLNFRYVQKRGKPTLALLTTPVLAFGCLALLLFVGFVGKGMTTRYRRGVWTETMTGSEHALQRSYRGLFLTRPARFDIDVEGSAQLAERSGGEIRHLFDEAGHQTLGGLRGTLWETMFVREERIVPLAGAIRMRVQSDILTEVINDSNQTLHNALVLDGQGDVYLVGDVASSGRAPIPTTTAFHFSGNPVSVEDRFFIELSDALGYSEDERPILFGLIKMGLQPTTVPTLLARLDVDGDDYAIFRHEHSVSLLQVRPRTQYMVQATAAPVLNSFDVVPDAAAQATEDSHPNPEVVEALAGVEPAGTPPPVTPPENPPENPPAEAGVGGGFAL